MTEAVALTVATGVTRGIGRAIANHLSALGHRVVGLSRIFRYFRSKSSLGRSIDEEDWRRTGQRSAVSTIEARARGVAPLYEMLDQWFGERTAAEAQIAATKHDVVLGPIYDTNDILAEPHFPARHNIVEMADDEGGVIRMPGITPRIEGVETAVRHLGPSRDDWAVKRPGFVAADQSVLESILVTC